MTNILRTNTLAVATLTALLLGGCSYSSVPQANKTEMSGDGFNQALARNYREFANYEAVKMEDWPDATTYAGKSLAAAAGNAPAPDDMATRSIAGDANVAELQSARVRLMQSLAADAAHKAPADAASAQANFDCWVEQQEEGWQTAHIAACKDGFWQAMHATEAAMAMAPAAQPAAQVVAAVPTQSVPLIVFFDWNSAVVKGGAAGILDQAVAQMRRTGHDVRLIGHTDASGAVPYNMKLSQDRAEAVKRYLVANGVALNAVETQGFGESDLLVATGDGVREPQNRRVEIELRTLMSSR
jgi:OOP family OmpA-OmpF porin